MKKFLISFIALIFLLIDSFSVEYIVVKGDCLWNIAKKYYNNPFLWTKIYQQNKDKIKNPDLIYPGQVFIIPDIEEIRTIEPVEIKQEIKQEEISLKETEKQKEKMIQILSQAVLQPVKEEEIKVEKDISEVKKTLLLKDFKRLGKIVSAKEKKFVYIDYDIIFCELEKCDDVEIGDIFYIYHLGPSQYDVTLLDVPKDQLTLVGKARVKEIKERKVVCEILRAYSPIVIGDMITR